MRVRSLRYKSVCVCSILYLDRHKIGPLGIRTADHLCHVTLKVLLATNSTNVSIHSPFPQRYLKSGISCNQPVLILPNSLTHLTFGRHFNQTVDSLPSSSLTSFLERNLIKK
eukprot:Phypoly_transcript_13247.p1 GENE.Phypoly_transcript_13247~~Phypoly_transcript_13247.p1  ORF type:complete len:112 (+),score=11.78 Phypoly_transcript_13247:268-603(+)